MASLKSLLTDSYRVSWETDLTKNVIIELLVATNNEE